jgi:hypothetical protein
MDNNEKEKICTGFALQAPLPSVLNILIFSCTIGLVDIGLAL